MRHLFSLSLALLELALLSSVVFAQEDPFGAAPKPAADGAAASTKKSPDLEAAARDAKSDPLAIQLLRASNPTTPRELLQAAQSALQYGRPDEAKRYLAKLLGVKPADKALASLTAQYADFLLQLDRIKELEPEGRQVVEMIYS